MASSLLPSKAETTRGGNALRSLHERRASVANYSFPGIYTAVTTCPGKCESNETSVHFAAEVDLIGIVESSLPSPYDGTGSDFCKISFLVRSDRELKEIAALVAAKPVSGKCFSSTAFNLQIDISETDRLIQSMKGDSSVESGEGNRHLQKYSTIKGFSCYRSLDGMVSWMKDIAITGSQITNLSIQRKNIGSSYQGSTIWALVVTGNGVSAKGVSTTKAPMFVMSGIHAREYAPPELVARWVEYLVNGYGKDADITSILDHTEIHLVLEANPDGRRVAETNRPVYQRKNTHDYSSGNCGAQGGVDLNRNFPFMWGLDSGSSNNPCALTYRGPSAASEPEVQAVVNYINSIFPSGQRKTTLTNQVNAASPELNMGVFIDIHSYQPNHNMALEFQRCPLP